MKKILSLVLAIVLAASAFLAAPLQLPGLVVSASAEETTAPSEGDLGEGNIGGESEVIPETEQFAFELNADGQSYTVRSATELTGEVIIPAEYNGLPVTTLSNIYGNFTSLVMPDSITTMDSYLFMGYTALEFVTLSKGLKEIPWGAFQDCTALKSIVIPEGVESIQENAFWGCSSLASVSIADSVRFISNYAFLDTAFYKNPDNWKNGALYCDKHLLTAEKNNDETFRIKDGTINVAPLAFYYRENLVSLYIPKSVKSIGYNCFHGCENITFLFYEGSVEDFNKIDLNENDTDYYLEETLVIFNADGNGVPKKVTTKSVSNVASGVQITWNAVANADVYVVWRRGTGTSDWTLLGITDQTAVIDTSAGHRQYWRYSVQAMNADGLSDFDYTGKYIKYIATPKLTGISNATNGIYFKWNKVTGASGYRVYRRESGKNWSYLGTVKGTSYTDKAVKNQSGKYYRYTVRAVVDGIYSGYEDFLYTKRLANPSLKSATRTSSGISVKWGAVSGSTGYFIYRKTANSGWTRVGTCYGVNTTTFVDKSAVKGTTYTYTVRAVCGKAVSYFNSGISCKR